MAATVYVAGINDPGFSLVGGGSFRQPRVHNVIWFRSVNYDFATAQWRSGKAELTSKRLAVIDQISS